MGNARLARPRLRVLAVIRHGTDTCNSGVYHHLARLRPASYDSCVLSETTLRLLWVVPPFDDFGLTDLTDTDRAAERREAIFGPFGVIGVKVDLEGVNG